jgi:hypothetical protein
MMMGDGWNWFRIFRTAYFDIRCAETSGSVCIVLGIFDTVPLSKWSWCQFFWVYYTALLKILVINNKKRETES